MCNHYIARPGPDLANRWIDGEPEMPDFDLWPKRFGPVLRTQEGERVLQLMHWGLIPFWTEDPKKVGSTHNAKSETADTKPSFREPFKRRRCLLPVTAFFERDASNEKKWVRISGGGEAPLMAAGLCDCWRPKDAEPVYSYTMLTCEPCDFMHTIHNRMPVLLPESAWEHWLDRTASPADAKALLVPFAGELASEAE